jgi:hypothetical protein
MQLTQTKRDLVINYYNQWQKEGGSTNLTFHQGMVDILKSIFLAAIPERLEYLKARTNQCKSMNNLHILRRQLIRDISLDLLN